MAELLFHGAAGEVTGSMHMIRLDGRWIALDCGLFQGSRDASEAKNRQWPVPPKEISAVVLSHAHTDHSGRLPKLVRDGFEGPIYCTPATRDLCAIMLPDSAHIQEEDIFYVNKKRQRKGLPPIEPLYGYKDALAAIGLMQTVSYNRWVQVEQGLLAMFQEAGHMLGSAGVRLEFAKRNGDTRSLYFSGDVGRLNIPVLRDPADMPPADVVLCESTYGGRVNEVAGDARVKFVRIVRDTVERGGKVIIPAFSVGRTQTLVYYLNQEFTSGGLPCIPVYVDSPLAVDATSVFKMHPECYDAEARQFQARNGDLLGNRCVTYIRDVEESKELHELKKPCVIISASGMCEAGRIRHHIKNNVENPANTLLIVGYQAQNTLGRRLAEGVKAINLFHETYQVRARVEQIHGFSAHADQSDLLRMLRPIKNDAKRVFLVHGEEDQADTLAGKLRGEGFASVERAQRGQRVAL
ncbi:MAG: MBL fold metallo-hydrolase [Phycisphaerae bacterium]